MYSRISSDKLISSNIKYTLVLLFLVAVSVITPLLVGDIKTKQRIEESHYYSIPELKPPVEHSAPEIFKLSDRRALNSHPYDFLLENELKQRFFTGEGPSSIYGLLDSVDARTQSLNQRGLENEPQCIGLDPVNITIDDWPLENLHIWVQCYEILNSDYILMFGRKDNVVYLYERGPATTLVAYITFNNEEPGDQYPCCYQVNGGGDKCVCDREQEVCVNGDLNNTINGGNCRTIPDAWPVPIPPEPVPVNDTNGTLLFDPEIDFADVNIYFSVGGSMSATQTGSRGLVHIESKPKSNFLQVAGAGVGLGFCGVQFVSNGDKIMVKGSMDGPGGTCLATNQTCVSNDLEVSYPMSNCTGSLGFSMVPLGRGSTTDFRGTQGNFDRWEASDFPGSLLNNVEIGNNPSSSVAFGPAQVPSILTSQPNRNFNF